jgi:two-component system chemotaxis response regulator CheY
MTKILVLDDSVSMVLSLARILKNAGFEVETGANGREGIAKLAAGLRPNIILTDLNMPEMDGVEFIKAVKRNSATKFTPVIVLTTESGGPKRAEAVAAGALGWLTKPTEPSLLLATLKQHLPK